MINDHHGPGHRLNKHDRAQIMHERAETRDTEVIYQVYPASFMDTNGDGVGDLAGILAKLDYIQSLHVDAVWISPFFLSPAGHEGDGGYAVENYREIDPRFGTMADFDALLTRAHELGLKIYTDFVLPHTSNRHEWFRKSERREAGFEDFYIWHDGKIDDPIVGEGAGEGPREGGAQRPGLPTNWLSIFGGSAWEWHAGRQQYYLHHFLSAQPALNLGREEVQDAALGEMKFWLDRGVDGFRIDALPHIGCDPEFRNDRWLNPNSVPDEPRWTDLFVEYSFCPDYIHVLTKRIRLLLDSYNPKRFALGEVLGGREGGRNSLPIAASFIGYDELNYCYTNELVSLTSYPTPKTIVKMVENIERYFPPKGGNCNTASNHDVARSATRLAGEVAPLHRAQALRQLLCLFICLPGSFTMYQGEELGLPQARIPEDIAFDQRKDVIITPFGPIEGRDGSRTPMPWLCGAKNAGFSESDQPYLPVPKSHYDLAVDMQENDPHSLLHFTRHLLQWRKVQPAMIKGHLSAHLAAEMPHLLALVRVSQNQTLVIIFNMGDEKLVFDPAILFDSNEKIRSALNNSGTIELNPFDVRFFGGIDRI
ncbi:MAG: alpha-glucosidase [Alphaproteobacteria bacterium]|nr:alpha-glucosidase [Alphaproteobacteria bacterium]